MRRIECGSCTCRSTHRGSTRWRSGSACWLDAYCAVGTSDPWRTCGRRSWRTSRTTTGREPGRTSGRTPAVRSMCETWEPPALVAAEFSQRDLVRRRGFVALGEDRAVPVALDQLEAP